MPNSIVVVFDVEQSDEFFAVPVLRRIGTRTPDAYGSRRGRSSRPSQPEPSCLAPGSICGIYGARAVGLRPARRASAGRAPDVAARPKLLYFVSVDWYFVSHRLPLAVAAKEAGYDVTVVTQVLKDGATIRDAGLKLAPITIGRASLHPWHEAQVGRRARRPIPAHRPRSRPQRRREARHLRLAGCSRGARQRRRQCAHGAGVGVQLRQRQGAQRCARW